MSKSENTEITKQELIKDLQTIAKKHPSITRDLYRKKSKYLESDWTGIFGTFEQFKREAGLKARKVADKFAEAIAMHNELDEIRKFYTEEVKPYCGKYEKDITVKDIVTGILITDVHDLDRDDFVLSVAIDTCDRMKPNYIWLGGDIFDMYEFSKYDKDPREIKLKERFEFVRERVFAPLRKACPNAQIDFFVGNHELRILKHLASKDPLMKVILEDIMGIGLAQIFGLDKYKINLVSKFDLSAYRANDIKSQMKQNHKVYCDCFVVSHEKDLRFGMSGASAHVHRPQTEVMANLPMGKISWTTVGSIARTNTCYEEKMDRFVNGFGIFHIDPKSKEVVPENIIILKDLAVVGGKYYRRKK